VNGDLEIRAEAVISRLADGAGSPEDWREFRALADRDPTLWRELAEWQHDHAELSAQVNAAVAIADDVDVDVQGEMTRRLSERLKLVATWGGWAAAAAIVLAWGIDLRNVQAPASSPQNAGLVSTLHSPSTASEAFDDYLEMGKEAGLVVGEVPTRVLVEARPTKAGGYELLYLRQVLERRRVDRVQTLATDEWGNVVPVPAAAPDLFGALDRSGLETRTKPATGAGPY
jgi:hypothetical protein